MVDAQTDIDRLERQAAAEAQKSASTQAELDRAREAAWVREVEAQQRWDEDFLATIQDRLARLSATEAARHADFLRALLAQPWAKHYLAWRAARIVRRDVAARAASLGQAIGIATPIGVGPTPDDGDADLRLPELVREIVAALAAEANGTAAQELEHIFAERDQGGSA